MKKKKQAKNVNRRVLVDHKKIGTTFVPPMLHRVGPWDYISRLNQTMPELIWWDEMSEEAGILEFYNYAYTPFSQCAHSTWYHVGRYNSGPSESPLTRQLWMPHIADSSSDIWNLHLAAKYLDKTFDVSDEKALHRPPSSAIQDWIYDEIQSRFGSDDRREGKP